MISRTVRFKLEGNNTETKQEVLFVSHWEPPVSLHLWHCSVPLKITASDTLMARSFTCASEKLSILTMKYKSTVFFPPKLPLNSQVQLLWMGGIGGCVRFYFFFPCTTSASNLSAPLGNLDTHKQRHTRGIVYSAGPFKGNVCSIMDQFNLIIIKLPIMRFCSHAGCLGCTKNKMALGRTVDALSKRQRLWVTSYEVRFGLIPLKFVSAFEMYICF